MAPKRDFVRTESNGATLSLRWRVGLSIVLLVHFLAVLVPPFTFATSSGPGMASPFAAPFMSGLRAYIDALFLDHGYFFFAPNPGPLHLVKARLEFADGRAPQELVFPDRQVHRPRLLYHRHFMIAEQFHSSFVPPRPPVELTSDPAGLAQWQRGRELYENRRRAIEQHLKTAHGASQVTVRRIEHALFGPGEFTQLRKPLQSPDTYHELPEEFGDMPPPVGPVLPTRSGAEKGAAS